MESPQIAINLQRINQMCDETTLIEFANQAALEKLIKLRSFIENTFIKIPNDLRASCALRNRQTTDKTHVDALTM